MGNVADGEGSMFSFLANTNTITFCSQDTVALASTQGRFVHPFHARTTSSALEQPHAK